MVELETLALPKPEGAQRELRPVDGQRADRVGGVGRLRGDADSRHVSEPDRVDRRRPEPQRQRQRQRQIEEEVVRDSQPETQRRERPELYRGGREVVDGQIEAHATRGRYEVPIRHALDRAPHAHARRLGLLSVRDPGPEREGREEEKRARRDARQHLITFCHESFNEEAHFQFDGLGYS
jgi:hypothetical protein